MSFNYLSCNQLVARKETVNELIVSTINGLPYPPANALICETRLNINSEINPYGPTNGLLVHAGVTTLPFRSDGEGLGIAAPFYKDPQNALTVQHIGPATKIIINQDGDYEIGLDMFGLVPAPDETYPAAPSTDSMMMVQVLRWSDTILNAPPATVAAGYYIPTTSLDPPFQTVAYGLYAGSGRSYAKLSQGDELKVDVLLTSGNAVIQVTSNITIKLLTPNILPS